MFRNSSGKKKLKKHLSPPKPKRFCLNRNKRGKEIVAANKVETIPLQVQVPDGVNAGDEFRVRCEGGRMFNIICPKGVESGRQIMINVPKWSGDDETASADQSESSFSTQQQNDNSPSTTPPQSPSRSRHQMNDSPLQRRSLQQKDMQTFEVMVPPHAQSGRAFALLAGGVRLQVLCPKEAGPGKLIRFRAPAALVQQPKKQTALAAQRLTYDKTAGWTRTVRASDMKLQWVRLNKDGGIDQNFAASSSSSLSSNPYEDHFDIEKSAYVRKLVFVNGTNPNKPQGHLSLVPASQAVVESSVRNEKNQVIIDYSEIANVQSLSYNEKSEWFKEKCKQLAVERDSTHLQVTVRRDHLLEDSMDAILSLDQRDLRKEWRISFMGEEGLDVGGLTRDWFQCLGKILFENDMGFWRTSEHNQMQLDIDPNSELFQCDNFRDFYRFVGRILGRAVFDGQLVTGRLVQYIYKHILGFPISFKDLNSYDQEYYNNLHQIKALADSDMDVEDTLCLVFATTVDIFGEKHQVPLVEGGEELPVTNDNYQDYLEACLKNRVMNRVQPQLTELLLGFFDVIPEALLAVFDHQELELLMCGLPHIDLQDWRVNTEYSGNYEYVDEDYPVCAWFWEVVESFDEEMKARLLQFVTGSSGVPSLGFAALHGNDGKTQKFTLNGVSLESCLYPRAHTCFNRLDLPCYDTKEELEEKLRLVVTMEATGFDME